MSGATLQALAAACNISPTCYAFNRSPNTLLPFSYLKTTAASPNVAARMLQHYCLMGGWKLLGMTHSQALDGCTGFKHSKVLSCFTICLHYRIHSQTQNSCRLFIAVSSPHKGEVP